MTTQTLQGEAGEAATTRVLLVEEAQQDFVFTEVPEKPVLSALRDFSAPVKLQVGCGDTLLRLAVPGIAADIAHFIRKQCKHS